MVTYRNKQALSKIDCFRYGTTQWIVCVGMISEGTNILRLQVYFVAAAMLVSGVGFFLRKTILKKAGPS